MDKWLDVTTSVFYTGKSTATINRLISKYKHDKKSISYTNNKPYINTDFLKNQYPFIHDNQNETDDNAKHKKEAMQLVYNSEALKATNDQLKTKDEHIKELIQQVNKKPYTWLYVAIGFVILIILILSAIWLYRSELLNNHKTKITEIAENNQKEVKVLTSSHEKEVKTLTSNVYSLKEQLTETKKSYTNLLTEIKTTHKKLTDIQSETISKKEKEIERLQKELGRVNQQAETIKNVSN